ncbi:hypothetical protein GCM10010983_16380 [Caulobacter rhizosphaerae]|nr:hypothetical protein GCM10010983_16380 [Caulobacter rhizosphaerae]
MAVETTVWSRALSRKTIISPARVVRRSVSVKVWAVIAFLRIVARYMRACRTVCKPNVDGGEALRDRDGRMRLSPTVSTLLRALAP